MAYVICEVSAGLRPAEAKVMIRDFEGRRQFLPIHREMLLHEGGQYYLPVGLIHIDEDQQAALVALPEEADSGAHRLWVRLDSLRQGSDRETIWPERGGIMAYVICEVSAGLRPAEATVMVRDFQGRRQFLPVPRASLLHEGERDYLPVGLIHIDEDQQAALVALPEEADSGVHRLWVHLDSLRQPIETTL